MIQKSIFMVAFLSSTIGFACDDLSGAFIRGNFSINVKQTSCDTLDIAWKTSGTQQIDEHVVVGKEMSNQGVSELWDWIGNNLVFQRSIVINAKLTKIETYKYSLDSNKNLSQESVVTFTSSTPTNLGKTVFKKM